MKKKDLPLKINKNKFRCDTCQKTVYKFPSRKKKYDHFFCNEGCYFKWMKGKHFSRETEFKKGHKQSKEQIEHRVQFLRGEKNSNWKGEKVGYTGLHYWVKREFLRQGKELACEKCGSSKKPHMANKSRKYKRDINDWVILCPKCHGKYDSGKNRGLLKRRFHMKGLAPKNPL